MEGEVRERGVSFESLTAPALLLLGFTLQDLLHQTQFPCLTVTGSSSGFSISACLRNTFPRHTRQSMRSKVGIRSRLITPATKLWGEESGWELQAGRLKTKQERGRERGRLYTAHGVKRVGGHSLLPDLISGPNRGLRDKPRIDPDKSRNSSLAQNKVETAN